MEKSILRFLYVFIILLAIIAPSFSEDNDGDDLDDDVWMTYTSGVPNYHQWFYHLVPWTENSNACWYGYNYTYAEHYQTLLDFNESFRYAEANERPIYFHCYPVEGTNIIRIQYWYFLGMNDLRQHNQTIQNTFHEGDWEHVEIQLLNYQGGTCGLCHTEEATPLDVNFYHHHGGYTRSPENTWWSNDSGEIRYGWDPDYNHLNVYLGANAHGAFNRYDQVYHMHANSVYGDEDFTDNPDYGSYNPLTFEYDTYVNLGERLSSDVFPSGSYQLRQCALDSANSTSLIVLPSYDTVGKDG